MMLEFPDHPGGSVTGYKLVKFVVLVGLEVVGVVGVAMTCDLLFGLG